MGKDKLKRFKENLSFSNLVQPVFDYPFSDHELKGKWNSKYFNNNNPVVLELGCGRGEYTVNLASIFPEKNFIGVDYKGARLWRGAKTAFEAKMLNVAFLRIQIQTIQYFFGTDEVDEIWITFPDPQVLKTGERKRLTSPRFLNLYRHFVKREGIINLKTDSEFLYEYTLEVLKEQRITPHKFSSDVYSDFPGDEILAIKTTYEERWLKNGSKIYYLRFPLNADGKR